MRFNCPRPVRFNCPINSSIEVGIIVWVKTKFVGTVIVLVLNRPPSKGLE